MKNILLITTLFILNSAFASDIVDVAKKAGEFRTLIKAASAADLVDVLKSDGPFTIFAPSDEAFAKVPSEDLSNLLKPNNLGKLQSVLKFHLISGKFNSNQLPILPIETLNGQKIRFSTNNDNLYVNDSKVLKADIEASNGIIHIIDSVLIPSFDPELSKSESIIMKGIKMGVPHFNHGNHSACADIYEMTLNCLNLLPKGELSSENRKIVSQTLKNLSGMKNSTDKAWAARKSLDRIISSSL